MYNKFVSYSVIFVDQPDKLLQNHWKICFRINRSCYCLAYGWFSWGHPGHLQFFLKCLTRNYPKPFSSFETEVTKSLQQVIWGRWFICVILWWKLVVGWHSQKKESLQPHIWVYTKAYQVHYCKCKEHGMRG